MIKGGRTETAIPGFLRFIERRLVPLLLLLLPFIVVPVEPTRWVLVWEANARAQSLAVNAAILAIVAYGLAILMRFAGLPSVVHGALWGAGAYTGGLLAKDLGWNFWYALPLTAIVPAVLALVVGIPALRTHGLAFIIMTIALADFLVLVGNNATGFTGGTYGLVLFQGPDPLGPLRFTTNLNRYYLALFFLYLTVGLVWLIANSGFGRRLMAIRDNEDLARSIGINAFLHKLLIFALSAAVVGIAGHLYMFHQRAIQPSLFNAFSFINVLLMVIMGGLNVLAGPAVGAWLVQFLPEWFAPLGLKDPNRQRIAFGLLLMAFMILAPRGIVGELKAAYFRLRDKVLLRQARVRASRPEALIPVFEAGPVGGGDDPRDSLMIDPVASSSTGEAALQSGRPPAADGAEQSPAPVAPTPNRSGDRTVSRPREIGPVILAVTGLSRNFGALRALSGVDFYVRQGEILGIIGPNGSGKTTLFNCVSGFFKPTEGRVVWQDRDITGWPLDRVARHGLVRTFQQPMLFRASTVRGSCRVAYESMSVFNHRRTEHLSLPRDIDGILEFCGLADVADQPALGLPYGTIRKLGVAVALSTLPQLLMLDEPAAGLNDIESEDLGRLLLRVRDAGVTLVVVDHDMPFLMPLCDRIVVLDAGQKICEGTPQEVGADERVIAAYLGETFAKRAAQILGVRRS